MARRFKRRRRIRRRPIRRFRRFRRSRRSIGRLFRKVNKISRSIEYKNIDDIANLGGAILSDGGDFMGLSLSQGTTALTRIGRDILIHRISFGGMIRVLEDGTATNNTLPVRCRMIIFLDKVCDNPGTPPALSDLYDTSFYTNPTFAYRNRDNYKKYKVLYDKTFNLAPWAYNDTSTYTGNRPWHIMKFNMKFKKGLKVRFAEGTTFPAYNNLYLYWFSDLPSQTNKFYPSIPSVYRRVTFSDC